MFLYQVLSRVVVTRVGVLLNKNNSFPVCDVEGYVLRRYLSGDIDLHSGGGKC